MRNSRFTDAPIIGMITEQEAGLSTAEACRKQWLAQSSLYKLKAKYGGMDVCAVARLKALEGEPPS